MNAIYIDDDAGNRAVLREMLATARVDLAEAADAGTGLRMLEQRSYGMILMDLRMPGMNGVTAIRQVRARAGAMVHVPIVIVTANLTPGERRICQQAGATAFLAKPVVMTELFDTIAACMASIETTLLH